MSVELSDIEYADLMDTAHSASDQSKLFHLEQVRRRLSLQWRTAGTLECSSPSRARRAGRT